MQNSFVIGFYLDLQPLSFGINIKFLSKFIVVIFLFIIVEQRKAEDVHPIHKFDYNNCEFTKSQLINLSIKVVR